MLKFKDQNERAEELIKRFTEEHPDTFYKMQNDETFLTIAPGTKAMKPMDLFYSKTAIF